FSSRRRHTRFSRDWSSDVCSSDRRLGTPRSGCRAPLDSRNEALLLRLRLPWVGRQAGAPSARKGEAPRLWVAGKVRAVRWVPGRSEERRVGERGGARGGGGPQGKG